MKSTRFLDEFVVSLKFLNLDPCLQNLRLQASELRLFQNENVKARAYCDVKDKRYI